MRQAAAVRHPAPVPHPAAEHFARLRSGCLRYARRITTPTSFRGAEWNQYPAAVPARWRSVSGNSIGEQTVNRNGESNVAVAVFCFRHPVRRWRGTQSSAPGKANGRRHSAGRKLPPTLRQALCTLTSRMADSHQFLGASYIHRCRSSPATPRHRPNLPVFPASSRDVRRYPRKADARTGSSPPPPDKPD